MDRSKFNAVRAVQDFCIADTVGDRTFRRGVPEILTDPKEIALMQTQGGYRLEYFHTSDEELNEWERERIKAERDVKLAADAFEQAVQRYEEARDQGMRTERALEEAKDRFEEVMAREPVPQDQEPEAPKPVEPEGPKPIGAHVTYMGSYGEVIGDKRFESGVSQYVEDPRLMKYLATNPEFELEFVWAEGEEPCESDPEAPAEDDLDVDDPELEDDPEGEDLELESSDELELSEASAEGEDDLPKGDSSSEPLPDPDSTEDESAGEPLESPPGEDVESSEPPEDGQTDPKEESSPSSSASKSTTKKSSSKKSSKKKSSSKKKKK